jgi:hypothetical protein
MKLSHKEWATIINALYVAEQQFIKDKKTAIEEKQHRVAEQFETQEVASRVLRAKIEQADIG